MACTCQFERLYVDKPPITTAVFNPISNKLIQSQMATFLDVIKHFVAFYFELLNIPTFEGVNGKLVDFIRV